MPLTGTCKSNWKSNGSARDQHWPISFWLPNGIEYIVPDMYRSQLSSLEEHWISNPNIFSLISGGELLVQ